MSRRLSTARRCLGPIVLLLALCPGPLATHAEEPLDTLVQALAAKGFKAKTKAVEALAADGDAAAAPVLEALLAGKLHYVKKGRKVVRVEKRDGRKLMFDPLAGAELGPARRKTKKITINNKLRRVIRGALGSLTLLSPSADVRRAAEQAVFRSPRADSLPLMEKALAKEIDDAVAHERRRAIAALRLTAGEDLGVRLAGAQALSDFPDPQVRDLLARVANDEATPAALKTASEECLAR